MKNDEIRPTKFDQENPYFGRSCDIGKIDEVLGYRFELGKPGSSLIGEIASEDMEEWYTIKGIGKLYIERELVNGSEPEPLFFVCIDEVDQRWIFMAYDFYEYVYIFAKTDVNSLLSMFRQEITMEEILRKSESIHETYIDENDELCYRTYASESFDERRLPDKGAYYNICTPYVRKYVDQLERIAASDNQK